MWWKCSWHFRKMCCMCMIGLFYYTKIMKSWEWRKVIFFVYFLKVQKHPYLSLQLYSDLFWRSCSHHWNAFLENLRTVQIQQNLHLLKKRQNNERKSKHDIADSQPPPSKSENMCVSVRQKWGMSSFQLGKLILTKHNIKPTNIKWNIGIWHSNCNLNLNMESRSTFIL